MEQRETGMTRKNMTLDRRSFVVGLTALMGATFVANNTVAIDAAVAYQSGARSNILTKKQLEMVKLIGEIIIPETNTPGAIAADVHGFIDYMLAEFMTAEARKGFLCGLDSLDARAGGFLTLSEDAQQSFVAQIDKDAYARGASRKAYGFYKSLKGWVTTGFFTSEAGMTEAGKYHPLPGPLHEVTRQEWLEYNGWI